MGVSHVGHSCSIFSHVASEVAFPNLPRLHFTPGINPNLGSKTDDRRAAMSVLCGAVLCGQAHRANEASEAAGVEDQSLRELDSNLSAIGTGSRFALFRSVGNALSKADTDLAARPGWLDMMLVRAPGWHSWFGPTAS